MSIQFTRTIPILASLNLDKTQSFYQEKLKFETLARFGGDYLIMKRGECVLHFWPCDDPYIAQSTGCYVHMQGVDELYAEYQAAGVVHPNSSLKNEPYGLREFAILDGDGNLIRFGEPIGS